MLELKSQTTAPAQRWRRWWRFCAGVRVVAAAAAVVGRINISATGATQAAAIDSQHHEKIWEQGRRKK